MCIEIKDHGFLIVEFYTTYEMTYWKFSKLLMYHEPSVCPKFSCGLLVRVWSKPLIRTLRIMVYSKGHIYKTSKGAWVENER